MKKEKIGYENEEGFMTNFLGWKIDFIKISEQELATHAWQDCKEAGCLTVTTPSGRVVSFQIATHSDGEAWDCDCELLSAEETDLRKKEIQTETTLLKKSLRGIRAEIKKVREERVKVKKIEDYSVLSGKICQLETREDSVLSRIAKLKRDLELLN